MSRIAAAPALLAALALASSSLVLALPATAAPAAQAADGDISWSVEPVPTPEGARRAFQYSVDPGTQVQDSVVIINSGTTETEFELYATDAINEPDTGAFGLLANDTEPTDVGGWITLADDTITLQPGTQATVPFNLLVPSDATPGEHVAGIVAAVLTKTTDDSGSAVVVEQRVGARVYLTVSGAAVTGIEVAGVTSTFTPSLNPFAPGDLTVGFEVRNTGNQRVDISPMVAVTGPFGIPLGTLDVDPVSELLPRQSVRFVVDVPAITALALVFSEVTATPGPVGSAVPTDPEIETDPEPTATPGAPETPAPVSTEPASAEPGSDSTDVPIVETETGPTYEPVSQSAPALAVSWTFLILLLVVVGLIFLVVRYVSGTRERLYLAIDEAAESARREALEQRGESGDTP